ncbi:MAG TPA: ATP-binding cassette domain-containing protein, partial [Bacillota bacterium]|nr:ATP-binding cassette domain-containing protein [Bacillota bacterium]
MAVAVDKVTANPNVKFGEVILEVKDLKKHFPVRRGFFASLKGGPHPVLKAVDGVSFKVKKGEIYGVVGESGCGKTTMARTL